MFEFSLWFFLLLIECGIVLGFAVLAYFASSLISRLFEKSKRIANLVLWTILSPLFLILGLGCTFYLNWYAVSIQEGGNLVYPEPLNIFMMAAQVWFLTIFVGVIAVIWLIGALIIFRQEHAIR
jgi:hypothetical protein